MAIQNSINQGIGAFGTAVAVAQHVSEQKKANELNEISQAEASYNQAKDLIKESENIADTSRGLEEGIQATQEELNESDNWSGPFRDEKSGKFITKDKYQLAKETALQEMQSQQKAIEAQKYDLTARMDLYNKRVDVLKLDKKGIAPNINKLATPEQLNKINYIRGGKE